MSTSTTFDSRLRPLVNCLEKGYIRKTQNFFITSAALSGHTLRISFAKNKGISHKRSMLVLTNPDNSKIWYTPFSSQDASVIAADLSELPSDFFTDTRDEFAVYLAVKVREEAILYRLTCTALPDLKDDEPDHRSYFLAPLYASSKEGSAGLFYFTEQKFLSVYFPPAASLYEYQLHNRVENLEKRDASLIFSCKVFPLEKSVVSFCLSSSNGQKLPLTEITALSGSTYTVAVPESMITELTGEDWSLFSLYACEDQTWEVPFRFFSGQARKALGTSDEPLYSFHTKTQEPRYLLFSSRKGVLFSSSSVPSLPLRYTDSATDFETFLQTASLQDTLDLTADFYTDTETSTIFELHDMILEPRCELFVILDQKALPEERLCFPARKTSQSAQKFSVDFTSAAARISSTKRFNRNIFLAVRCGESYGIFYLKSPAPLDAPVFNLRQKISSKLHTNTPFPSQIFTSVWEGQEVSMAIEVTQHRRYIAYTTETSLCYLKQYTGFILNLAIHGHYLHIKMVVNDVSQHWCGFRFFFRFIKEEHRQEYFFPARHVARLGKLTYLSGKIDLDTIEFHPTFWDIRPVFEKDSRQYLGSMKTFTRFFKWKYSSIFSRNRYFTPAGEIVFPYITITNSLAFTVREKAPHDTLSFRLKERAALLLSKIRKSYFKRQNIYLIYEKFCFAAQDNGFCLFRYCMDHDVEKEQNCHIYYVIDKTSPDYEKLKPYEDHVIDFLSFKHLLYIIACRLLISSDSKTHAYAWQPQTGSLLPKVISKKHVFLQHGVLALKRVEGVYKKAPNQPASCDLFITSSDAEKKIVADNFGYTDAEIAVTGLARWDFLNDTSAGKKEILIMPTWRSWLDSLSHEDFIESDYYKNYVEFLQSPKLLELLKKDGIQLNFFIHPKFKDYISDFTSDHPQIRLIPFGEVALNELLMSCRMLITDYSSVCWDVYYQKKPILFYQFDYDIYEEIHGSYIDMTKELFGPRSVTLDELLEQLKHAIDTDFALEEPYLSQQRSHYKYIDKNNCKRTMDAIQKRFPTAH